MYIYNYNSYYNKNVILICMLENKEYFKENKISSERGFGIVFSIFFTILFLYFYLKYNYFNIYFFSLSIILLFISIFFAHYLRIPNILWHKFGILISKVMNPVVVTLIYLIGIIPIGIIMKLLKKDLIQKKINKNLHSYWIKKKNNIGRMRDQF